LSHTCTRKPQGAWSWDITTLQNLDYHKSGCTLYVIKVNSLGCDITVHFYYMYLLISSFLIIASFSYLTFFCWCIVVL